VSSSSSGGFVRMQRGGSGGYIHVWIVFIYYFYWVASWTGLSYGGCVIDTGIGVFLLWGFIGIFQWVNISLDCFVRQGHSLSG
jgi:hypothetical protein